MDFENALFRVHERTLSCFRPTDEGGPSKATKACRLLQKGFVLLFAATAAVFFLAHIKYVNTGTCMEESILRTLAAEDRNNHAGANGTRAESGRNTSAIPVGPGHTQIFDDDVVHVQISPLSLSASERTFSPEYEFSATGSILYLSEKKRAKHFFRVLNVTLDSDCIGMYWFAELVGMDTVVINQLMFSLESDGMLKNLKTGEMWNWSGRQVSANKAEKMRSNFFRWFGSRLLMLIGMIISFAVMSGITAVMISVLVSSGVILVFPLFLCLQRYVQPRLDMTLLTLSYPWLGVEIGYMLRTGAAIGKFIGSHICYLITFYVMFEFSQLSWSTFVYDKSYPSGLPMLTATGLMVLEYFNMVYIRSLSGTIYFPKMAALAFVFFHSYFYCTLYGFFYLAAVMSALAMLFAMSWFLLESEVPALESGMICLEVPRSRFVHVNVPSWPGSLAHLVTVFHLVGDYTFPSIYEGPQMPLEEVAVEDLDEQDEESNQQEDADARE